MASSEISLQDLTERYHLSQDLLDKEVSKDHLRKVSDIIDDHNIVGPELGLTDQDMCTINDVNRQELQKRETLKKWNQKYAWNATYRKLIEALLRCHRAGLARDVCELLHHSKFFWSYTCKCAHVVNTIHYYDCRCAS